MSGITDSERIGSMVGEISKQVASNLRGKNLSELSQELEIPRSVLGQMQDGDITNLNAISVEKVRRHVSNAENHDSYATG